MSGIMQMLVGAVVNATDAFFEYVTLLLPGDGTNGAQNNTFLDGSTNNFTITRNGNTTQGTFSPFSQTGWGNYFDGNADYIQVPAGAFAFSTGDYTFECFVNLSALPAGGSYYMLYDARSGATATNHYILIDSSGYLVFRNDGETTTTTQPLKVGVWTHIAQARSGTTLKTFVGGVEVNSKTSNDDLSIGSAVEIGYSSNDGNYALNGYVSNLRTVIGTAAYTAAFTPPTSPLTAISGTSLLTCQSNRFIDNSSNAFAITRNGDVSVQAFSPFNPTAAWSAATYGGSGYFDGSGDYLTVADNAALDMGSSDFTIEGWIFPAVSSGGSVGIFSKRASGGTTAGVLLYYNLAGLTPTLLVESGGSWVVNQASSIAFTANQWNHFAVVRNGSSFVLYINGTSGATGTSAGSVTDNASAFAIGAWAADGTGVISASYISNFRIVKGTAVYTAAFTPPTAPLTAITNTSLLLNFTNAGILDATAKNDLETVGNAQISTTQSKWGGGSIAFDGTGDYLTSNPSASNIYAFGTGDFTIEFWLRLGSVSGNQSLVDIRPTGTNGLYPLIYASTTSLVYYVDSASRISGGTLSTGTWYHVAVARSGTSTKLFLDGTQIGSTYTDSSNYLAGAGAPWIGAFRDGTGPLNGYIDDLRITKGVARYTAAFTPPTAAFPLY